MSLPEPLAFWSSLPPELRALLLLPVLAVVLGRVLVRMLGDDAASLRLAWPAVLAASALAALGILLAGLPALALLPSAPALDAGVPALLWPLAALWAGIALLLDAAIILRHRRLVSRWLLASRPAAPALERTLSELADTAGMPAPMLRLVDGAGPACIGIRGPMILLPMNAADWEPGRLRSVLAHELVHAQRRDPALLLLTELVGVWLWPLPGRAFVHQRWREAVEAGCDEDAVQLAGDAEGYAQALIDAARAPSPRWLAALSSPALRERIRRILGGVVGRDLAVGRIYWSLVLAWAIALPGVMLAPGVDSPPERPAPSVASRWLDLTVVPAAPSPDPVARAARTLPPRPPPAQLPPPSATDPPRL